MAPMASTVPMMMFCASMIGIPVVVSLSTWVQLDGMAFLSFTCARYRDGERA